MQGIIGLNIIEPISFQYDMFKYHKYDNFFVLFTRPFQSIISTLADIATIPTIYS
jgi:hypothetical protein